MPRAKIPYDELTEIVRKKYPWPTFKGVSIVNDHVYHTPKVVYVRKDGMYVPYGWKFAVAGFRFDGIDENMQPQYVYYRQIIVVPRT
tara:strand:- start:21 stop:281 length:261 start_codon:yes stop_codon:yes gene_type:complete